jgi:hypothetical protein
MDMPSLALMSHALTSCNDKGHTVIRAAFLLLLLLPL